MSKRADEIRRKIEKRRKQNYQNKKANPAFFVSDEEKHGFPPLYSSSFEENDNGHPLFRKETLIFKVMIAIALFLIVGIVFKSGSPQFSQAKSFVQTTFEKEFQFATVANWYEDQFGKPLALLPVNTHESEPENEIGSTPSSEPVYALPAAGKIMESFSSNGSGIMVETGVGSAIETIDEGFVVFAGVKNDIGKTVVIQHPNGSETWYGNLEKINVKLYDFVEKRTKVGEVATTEDGKSGVFYFAIKKGDSFIDPNKVIPFD